MNPSASRRKKLAIPILSGVIILGCLLVFFFRFSLLGDLEESLAETEREVQTMRRNIKNADNLEEDLERIKALADQVNARAVEPEDTAVNIDYFYQFETEGLEISAVDQRDVPAGKEETPWTMKNFGVTLFSIQATGDFQEIMDFLFRVRGGPKLVRVVNFSVTPSEGEDLRRISLTLQALANPPKKSEE